MTTTAPTALPPATADAETDATSMPRHHSHVRAITVVGIAAFALVFAISVWLWGLPWSRDRVAVWTLVGIGAASLGNLRAWARGLVVDWAPLLGVLFAYDLLRGYADDLGTRAHLWPQLRFDEVLFGGTVPTVALQQALWDPTRAPRWYDYAAWVTYTSHFFVTIVVAAVLWRVAHHRFRRFAAMFVTLTLVGFATYAAFPAVPPWMASQAGALEPTYRIVPAMWGFVGVDPAATIFESGSRYANDVAAVPSLHAAYPVLLALFFWRRAAWHLRALLASYPPAMALALVYGAEHYVADVLLGWVYALAVFAAFAAAAVPLRRRRARAHDSPLPL